MDEDDTFRILSRMPFQQIKDILSNTPVYPSMSEVEKFLSKYNWTFDEYIYIYYDYLHIEYRKHYTREEYIESQHTFLSDK